MNEWLRMNVVYQCYSSD